MKNRTVKMLSILLCLFMLVSMIPAAAMAAEGTGSDGASTPSSSATPSTAAKHTVTVLQNSGYINNGKTSGEFSPGETITITARSVDVCTEFYCWSASGVVLGNLFAEQTTFVMPAGDVYLVASFDEKHDFDSNGACKNCKEGYYKVTAGAGSKWKKGSDSGLSFTANGDLSDFTNVLIDDVKLTQNAQYTASSGSTVINLDYKYLNTLDDGKHIITIEYRDGDCFAEFTIEEAPALTSRAIKSIVMEVSADKPAVGKPLYTPSIVSVNGRTDQAALSLLREYGSVWYCSENYSTNSAAYELYENEKNVFEAGYAYNLYTNLAAAAGASFDEKCTFTIKTPAGKLTGSRYETKNDNTSFDVFFDVLTDGTTTTTTTTTTTAPTTVPTTAPTSGSASVNRLSGDNRYATAIDISSEGWNKADTVVIASGENYPDALAGTVLAKVKNAPILLVKKNSVDSAVISELKRLDTKNVIILGGEAAISKKVADELGKSCKVSRIGGSSRNDTAARIAMQTTETSSEVFLVSNKTFADALSAGSAAALSGAPILYVNPDGTIPAETDTALKKLDCSRAYVIGGKAAVSDKIENELDKLDISCIRIAGETRYETSLKVYYQFHKLFTADSAAIATGSNYPDALAGVAFAARNGMPVFLVGSSAPDVLVTAFAGMDIENLYVFGGEKVVPDSVVDALVK